MEAKYGSLGRGMLAARAKMGSASPSNRALFTSLKNGMQQMVDAIRARLTQSFVQTGVKVEAVHSISDGWLVATGGHADQYDAVIVATPAHVTSKLLQAASPQLATDLSGIAYTSSITVNLGYDRAVRNALPPGFGFLIPRSEGKRMLACTFVHNKFPHRAPEDRALLRCFIGGSRNEEVLQAPDAEIIGIVRNELAEILGLSAEPRFSRIYRWKSAMAQYGVGHLERLERIERLRQQLPGLYLAGNAYRGVGVPDCVRSGTDAAANSLASLGIAQMSSARP
jgi:oxygen-dependent protoporphyrinogen oxidase